MPSDLQRFRFECTRNHVYHNIEDIRQLFQCVKERSYKQDLSPNEAAELLLFWRVLRQSALAQRNAELLLEVYVSSAEHCFSAGEYRQFLVLSLHIIAMTHIENFPKRQEFSENIVLVIACIEDLKGSDALVARLISMLTPSERAVLLSRKCFAWRVWKSIQHKQAHRFLKLYSSVEEDKIKRIMDLGLTRMQRAVLTAFPVAFYSLSTPTFCKALGVEYKDLDILLADSKSTGKHVAAAVDLDRIVFKYLPSGKTIT